MIVALMSWELIWMMDKLLLGRYSFLGWDMFFYGLPIMIALIFIPVLIFSLFNGAFSFFYKKFT